MKSMTKKLDEVRNTVKVAVLEGDHVAKDLLAISFYDTKPVYFLSTVVEWLKMSRKIYSKTMQQKVDNFSTS